MPCRAAPAGPARAGAAPLPAGRAAAQSSGRCAAAAAACAPRATRGARPARHRTRGERASAAGPQGGVGCCRARRADAAGTASRRLAACPPPPPAPQRWRRRSGGAQAAHAQAAATTSTPPGAPPHADASSAIAALRAAAAAHAGGAADACSVGRDGVAAFGHGRHLGLPVRWRLHSSCDGSFFEEVCAPQVAFCWGFDAPTGRLWEADHAGAGGLLELDDREVVLLSLWARTGFWLRPAAAEHLEFWLDAGGADVADEEDADTVDMLDELGEAGGGKDEGESVRLCVRLRDGGRLVARLRACARSGAARALRLRVAGDAECWTFAGQGPHGLPARVQHAAASGARDAYRLDGARPPGPLPAALFAPPPGALTSLSGATYDARVPARVPVERSRSGHTLVRMALNGADAGLAILDTGASGFVISRAAADAAGLEAFGEVFVSGVGTKIPARFRRAATVTVGPLTVASPLLLEMELRDLVWGASSPCIGIVGYDLFRRAVVDMPPPPAAHVELHHPSAWAPPPPDAAATWRWLRVAMVANVPHAYARFHGSGEADAAPPELLMLDSGAGGADAIFHARAVARLGLSAVGTYAGTSSIRGVSGSEPPRRAPAAAAANGRAGGATPTQRRQLEWLELLPHGGAGADANAEDAAADGVDASRSVHFAGVDALMLGTLGAFDLSEHMSGVVCMPLLARGRVVLDLLRRRVAFVSDAAARDAAAAAEEEEDRASLVPPLPLD